MSELDPPSPPESTPPPSPSSSPPSPNAPSDREGRKRRLESAIPEIVRRALELGVEKARESPDSLKQFVSELKLPKDIARYLFQQIDDTRSDLFRVVAGEIRDFLDHTNVAGELRKILTTVQFEVNTTIRFTPNSGNEPTPTGKSDPSGKSGDETETSGDSKTPTPTKKVEAREASSTGDPNETKPASLPKPEIRTAMRVRRHERPHEPRRPHA
ncbi:MAG: hypothetical protein FWD73_12510 [Polyangiaceae bacterium]|nr:hypothetical protein [Polyangiaceae bacterium]